MHIVGVVANSCAPSYTFLVHIDTHALTLFHTRTQTSGKLEGAGTSSAGEGSLRVGVPTNVGTAPPREEPEVASTSEECPVLVRGLFFVLLHGVLLHGVLLLGVLLHASHMVSYTPHHHIHRLGTMSKSAGSSAGAAAAWPLRPAGVDGSS